MMIIINDDDGDTMMTYGVLVMATLGARDSDS